MRRIYVVWIICWTILNGFRNSWVFNIYLGFRNTSTACWSGKQTIGKGCLSRISPTQITAIGTLTFWDDHLVPPVLSEMTITVIGTFCYATTSHGSITPWLGPPPPSPPPRRRELHLPVISRGMTRLPMTKLPFEKLDLHHFLKNRKLLWAIGKLWIMPLAAPPSRSPTPPWL